MTGIADIERLVDRLCTTLKSIRAERDQLRQELDGLRGKFAEKDLELIRAAKESQRSLEVMEREKMAIRREKEQIEGQLKSIYERSSTLMPELSEGVAPQAPERGVKG